MNKGSDAELLPCPFCGGEAQRFTIGDDEPNNAGGDVICCKRCGASSHVEFGRKENLVSRWNTRALTNAIIPAKTGMEPRDNPRQPIFRDHNCWKCREGEKPCAEGNYNCCSYPRARND